MNMLRHLPNLLTISNLTLGVVGILALLENNPMQALFCMGGCLLADTFDGPLARRLGADNALGVQLDSLADVISFGALPAVMIYYTGTHYGANIPYQCLAVLSALVAASAGLRLGRFNVDTRPREFFYGLATPAGAICIAGWMWAEVSGNTDFFKSSERQWIFTALPLFLIIAYHLSVRLPGLKSPPTGFLTAIIIVIEVVAGFMFIGPIAITFGIIHYVLTGVVNTFVKWY